LSKKVAALQMALRLGFTCSNARFGFVKVVAFGCMLKAFAEHTVWPLY